jgi:TolB-like protein/cytochrome c-type biogenesis protein CcmH/NrfG
MPDIFISYSRTDFDRAVRLVEQLRQSGLSVWMDTAGISAAEQWSAEIVDAIEAATAVILLISRKSNSSVNVHREIALASESNKYIVPVELERVPLSRELKYPLAGLQRIGIGEFDQIVESLAKLGITPSSSQPAASNQQPTPPKDDRKSLMILPFEDLSPTQDNAWFADGLMSEMISSLSHIKSLRLIDQKTSLEYRGYRGKTMEIARELHVRYFIEGSVRKFGEQIKITLQLLDIEEGEYLWTDSHRGEFKEIFDMQEEVARKVVEGLKLALTKEEEKRLLDRGTENPEAYQLWLKAGEYYQRHTREGLQHAGSLLSEALRLDPGYAAAHEYRALVLNALYHSYDRDPGYLAEAEVVARKALELKPELWNALKVLCLICLHQGRLQEAEAMALEYVRRVPENFDSHSFLGHFYSETNHPGKALAPYQEAIRSNPEDLTNYWNLIVAFDRLGDMESVRKWSEIALPLFERRLMIHPDNETARVWYANLLFYAGRGDAAIEMLDELRHWRNLDGNSLYNIACLYSDLKEYPDALAMLERGVAAGFSNIEILRTDPDLDPLRAMPEFEKLLREMEGKEMQRAPAP